MTKVIAIANQKGGVGKTSTTVNLGAGLVRQGYAVLAIDFDPQANLTMALGFKSPDDMEYTVSNVLAKAMDEEPIDPAEGILTTEEGVDLMPSSNRKLKLEIDITMLARHFHCPIGRLNKFCTISRNVLIARDIDIVLVTLGDTNHDTRIVLEQCVINRVGTSEISQPQCRRILGSFPNGTFAASCVLSVHMNACLREVVVEVFARLIRVSGVGLHFVFLLVLCLCCSCFL